MNEEQEQQLLDYLGSLGFKSEALSAEIHEKQQKSFPSFKVRYDIRFGNEKVRFDLDFRRDHQFNAYRLEEYKATHRKPVVIDQQVINGVSTGSLDQRMKDIDWDSYFKTNERIADPALNKKVDAVLSDLWNLDAENNAAGLDIQRKLQYKYFPEHTYDSSAMYFISELEHGRMFLPHETGMCNANLAYHITSGKLDDLFEKLAPVALDQYSGKDLYIELERILSGNPDSFELKFSHNQPEGFSEVVVPIHKENGDYVAICYTATLTPYPPIEHDKYNGIDSKKLEDMMREINWHDDRQLFIFREDAEPEFPQRVNDVQEQIYRLSQDTSGAEIADRLQLKYWSDATFFQDMIGQEGWDYLDNLPKRTHDFPVETDARAAVNLLNGRAVMEDLVYSLLRESDGWIRLSVNQTDGQQQYATQQINGFGKTELENVLNVFQIPTSDYYQVRNSLMRGDMIEVRLVNDKKVLMEANPEQRIINVYTPDMRLIPTNVHLDPDWKPPLGMQSLPKQPEQKKQHPANKYQTIKAVKGRKGRGL